MKVYVLVHKLYVSEVPNYGESYSQWNEGAFLKREAALSKAIYNNVIDNKYYKHGNDKTRWAEWYEIEEYFLEVTE